MDFSGIKIKAAEVYPDWTVTEPNLKEAAVLQQDYAGKGSETTAVMTYTYQHYVVAPYDEGIAAVLEKIAIVEMTHHDILGNIITALGGNPVIGAAGRYWSGANVNYNRNLKEMLIGNIAAEEAAIIGYKASIRKMSNQSIIDVLEAIIEDEKTHIAAFKEILEYITFWK